LCCCIKGINQKVGPGKFYFSLKITLLIIIQEDADFSDRAV